MPSEATAAQGVFKQDPEQKTDHEALLDALQQTEAVIKGLLIRIKNDAAMGPEDDAVPRWIEQARGNFENGLMWAEVAITRPNGGIGRMK